MRSAVGPGAERSGGWKRSGVSASLQLSFSTLPRFSTSHKTPPHFIAVLGMAWGPRRACVRACVRLQKAEGGHDPASVLPF